MPPSRRCVAGRVRYSYVVLQSATVPLVSTRQRRSLINLNGGRVRTTISYSGYHTAWLFCVQASIILHTSLREVHTTSEHEYECSSTARRQRWLHGNRSYSHEWRTKFLVRPPLSATRGNPPLKGKGGKIDLFPVGGGLRRVADNTRTPDDF